MGNTKVLGTVSGPAEVRGGARKEGQERDNAVVVVEVGIAGFSGVDRKRRGRGDKYVFVGNLWPIFDWGKGGGMADSFIFDVQEND